MKSLSPAVVLDNYRGRVGQLHTQVEWGWDYTLEAMRTVVSHYQRSSSQDPAFVIFHVAAEPHDKSEIRSLLQNSAGLGVFWLFVGFTSGAGRGRVADDLAFYANLNASASATFTNVAFHDAGQNPGSVPDDQFYATLTQAFTTWLTSR